MVKVLVVDDSATMREIVGSFLGNNGFDVITATDGRDGLAQMRGDASVQLVISDINMPHMDGLTMAEKIRSELGNHQVRIVMLTTEDNQAMRERGRAAGVNGWIVKPFRGERVLGPLKKLCGVS